MVSYKGGGGKGGWGPRQRGPLKCIFPRQPITFLVNIIDNKHELQCFVDLDFQLFFSRKKWSKPYLHHQNVEFGDTKELDKDIE